MERAVMSMAVLDHADGVGTTMLALHVSGASANHDQRVMLIDADPRGSLDNRADATACIPHLTVDVTPALPGLVMIKALHRYATVAARLRGLLAGAFPAEGDVQ
jgi:anion-transporting  ArsA/GET3 family ATPase